jgi:phage terminase small subunit
MVDLARPLEPMQIRFVNEYIADSSSTRAAMIRAGYSIDTADQAGSRLLKDPRVQALISEANKKAADGLRITAERVLQELWKIAGANPGDTVLIEEDGEASINPRAAGELTVTTVTGGDKKIKSVTAKTIKPSDKLNALEKIAKITNMFPKEQAEVKVELSLTDLIERSMEELPQPSAPQLEILDTEAA